MSKRSQRESYSTDQNNKDPLEPSSSKRVRFQTSDDSAATDPIVKEEGEYEFDHETYLEKAKLRRGAVKLQGYASDETDTSDDDGTALFNRRKGKDTADDLDDMFADDDISSKQKGSLDVIGKKKVKYLELDEIEGQEYTSRDAYDEESGEPIIEAFNMKAEMEEGRFDEAGNYVRNKKDPSAFHDKWLQGLSQKDIEKAKRAHEKQEQERKLKEAEEASRGPLDRVSIWKDLLAIMKQGETLLDTLQRLGGGLSNKGKNKRGQKHYKKKRGKTDETMEMAIDKEELTPEEIAEQERKKQIEILTDLSDKMMALGHFNVYDDTWEQILRNLKREKAVPEDWIPVNFEEEKEAENDSLNTPFDEFSSNIATTQQLYWEYKWIDSSDANSNDIYGPFSGEDMKAWNDQGFFAQGVLVRKAGSEDEFTSSTGIDFTCFT
ncbi:3301_t:CDS:1 [Funneliformis geosporum]|uniref:18930_t:CDS:1 n=1 Tax=Funneliformis geosporum TaxID=1117311 RepID=A0A9W4WS20_9GLOM|nr:18930_t:CDS:1 [Funneliformis geosporum]CAI2181993.1 3301_t:CDS:1 [Funneliformis geosporum]